jgi:hypothetical protein
MIFKENDKDIKILAENKRILEYRNKDNSDKT